MSDLLIPDLPEDVHRKLREIAAREGRSVEAVAREALVQAAEAPAEPGLFERLAEIRKELGIDEDWPSWPAHFDDPAFSRHVLGLDDEDYAPPESSPPSPTNRRVDDGDS